MPALIVPVVVVLLALAFAAGALWVLVRIQDERAWYLCGGMRGSKPCGYWVRPGSICNKCGFVVPRGWRGPADSGRLWR